MQEGFEDFSFARVSYYSPKRKWQGQMIDRIDRMINGDRTTGMDTQLDMVMEMVANGGAQMVYHNLCTDVMDRLPSVEVNMVGTDSAIRSEDRKSIPHPRGWGAFPRFIRYFVREKGTLSIDEAIYRMTGLPARVFQLDHRGLIREHHFADLVLFDSRKISDRATYEDPFATPNGIRCVVVNGEVVLESDVAHEKAAGNGIQATREVFPGRFLKRVSWQ
jgi:N-acyl-D-aspartate/D-glutamate deacylase